MLPRQVKVAITYDGTAKKTEAQETKSNTAESLQEGTKYTVKRGDTLWAIAKQYYGDGKKYTIIYDANTELIESTARAHGMKSSEKGHWIWAGEELTLPGEKQETKASKAQTTTGSSNPALGQKIESQLTSVDYTDVASGQSDSVSLSMHDIGKEWMGAYMPKKGADIGVKIDASLWEGNRLFDCGTFVIDDISFSSKPTLCTIGGVSIPANDDFKSLPKSQTYEKTTIKEIASRIASAAGVSLAFDAADIPIAEMEQSGQTDSAFLYSVCDKYGLSLKVYNHKLVIFDPVKYEEKEAVATLTESDMERWSYNTTVDGTYTGVTLNYSDPDSDETLNVTIGKEGRMYSVNSQASGRHDAELQAAAKVNQANRSAETMEVTISPNNNLIASHCVNISGLANIDGKYFIDKIKHSISGSRYQMSLSLHKCQGAIKTSEPVATAETKSQGKTYTVKRGDTLWGIAKSFYGDGKKWPVIYNANTEVIESTAKAHGKQSSENGRWIWAGEVYTIPEA